MWNLERLPRNARRATDTTRREPETVALQSKGLGSRSFGGRASEKLRSDPSSESKSRGKMPPKQAMEVTCF